MRFLNHILQLIFDKIINHEYFYSVDCKIANIQEFTK